jgi:hypothetical protein
MIAWRNITAIHATADIRICGCAVARLHARPDRWTVELLDGTVNGAAGSLGHAKRAALEELAKLLPDIELAIQAALRST